MKNSISKLPKDPFSMIGYLSLYGIQKRKKESLQEIKLYKNRKKFYYIHDFVEYVWFDSCKGDIQSISGINYLPINQASIEYYDCIEMAIFANYKAAYSSLRRLFEMAILQIYFSNDSSDKKKASNWYLSKDNAPSFSIMVENIGSSGILVENGLI
jgi:hypothetical protein